MIIELYDHNKTYNGQKKFDCGNSTINKYVAKNLKSQVRESLCTAYVLVNNNTLIGFYTVSAFCISNVNPHFQNTSLPKNIPCIRLIMLGVDISHQKKGLGHKLLLDAIDRMIAVANQLGVYGLYLDADPNAIDFYKKHAFSIIDSSQNSLSTKMFLNIKTVIEAKKAAQ